MCTYTGHGLRDIFHAPLRAVVVRHGSVVAERLDAELAVLDVATGLQAPGRTLVGKHSSMVCSTDEQAGEGGVPHL